ncbi:MAG: ABC transporter ATP-binding protein [Planctomycetaceae bacterium]|nr:ABC transporter ATP-binding protein [Planctomycetaceae bacterium]
MSELAISVENVSKRFHLGQDAGYSRLSESLQSAFSGWMGTKSNSDNENSSQEFWALKDVSFEVQPGEVLGIIGRNGAGKSTLLKILSRITRPTSGRIGTRGRVGSLLEVGTGFHPELTGRENVFLNGSILGMQRADIARKFDEIVAFAELGDFIDTPVKRYSSGMYARLAFSVAAHLEPEILIIDEVLAVGDAAFQKQCLGKMSDVANQGRTVLFVSHNMAAIKTLCQRALVLDKGRIASSGNVEDAINKYLGLHDSCAKVPVVKLEPCKYPLESIQVSLLNQGHATNRYFSGDQINLEVKFKAKTPVQQLHIGFEINSQNGECVIASSTRYLSTEHFSKPTQTGTVRCSLGMVPLMPGDYSFSFWFGTGHEETDIFHHALAFEVVERNIWETTAVPGHENSKLWWPTEFTFSVD